MCSCGSGSPWRPWSPSSSAAASPPSSAAAADAAEKPHRLQSQLQAAEWQAVSTHCHSPHYSTNQNLKCVQGNVFIGHLV